MEPDRRLPPKSKPVNADREPIWLGTAPANSPSDKSRPVTRPPETVTPVQESTVPLPQERMGCSAGRAALSGLPSQRLRAATRFWQSPTKAEAGSATQVPSEHPPAAKAAASPSLPKMTTSAGVVTRSAATPETMIVSAPSETASSTTATVKSTEALLCPAGMTI